MDSIPISVEVGCPRCKERTLATDDEGELKDDSIVYCKSCGLKVGPWGEVKQRLLAAAAEKLKRSFEPS